MEFNEHFSYIFKYTRICRKKYWNVQMKLNKMPETSTAKSPRFHRVSTAEIDTAISPQGSQFSTVELKFLPGGRFRVHRDRGRNPPRFSTQMKTCPPRTRGPSSFHANCTVLTTISGTNRHFEHSRHLLLGGRPYKEHLWNSPPEPRIKPRTFGLTVLRVTTRLPLHSANFW